MKWFTFGLLLLSIAPFASAETKFEFKETSATDLQLSEDGKPVFVYIFGPVLKEGFEKRLERSSYMHPVYAPDGTVITDDFNKDHPHHRGIMWDFCDVSVGAKHGDMWNLKGDYRQKFVAWKTRDVTPDSAHLVVENGWFDGDKKFAKEQVDVVTHATKDNTRVLDFTLTFEALDQPVGVKGTSEGNKWYGGFGFRFAPRDGGEKKTTLTTEAGVLPKDGVMSVHPWAQVSGLFGGKPESGRVDDDASNPGSPHNGWLLRHGFGLLNVCYPGPTQITLEPGKPLVLKYKVTLCSGDAVKQP